MLTTSLLFHIPQTLSEPDRRRARLLSVLLLTLSVLVPLAFLIAAFTDRTASPFENPATPVAAAAFPLLLLTYLLNRFGRYILAAQLLVTVASAGAWAAILVNTEGTEVDPLILAFVLQSVLLSSILLRIQETTLIATLHIFLMLFVFPTMTTAIIFISFTSGLLIVAAFVTKSDLAQIERQTQELMQSERRLRALVEHSSDAIVLVGAEGDVRYQSPPANRILGHPLSDAPQSQANLFDRIHPDDRPDAMRMFQKILRDPTQVITVQYRVQHFDGSWRWLEIVGKNMLDQPIVSAIVANYRDITGRKQAEQQIQRQVQYLNALHEVGLAIIDSLDLRVTAGVILEKTKEELKVDAAALFLLNDESQELTFLDGRGFQSRENRPDEGGLGTALASRVVASRQMLTFRDLRIQGPDQVYPSLPAEEEFVAYVGVPLLAKGQMKGVLEVFQRSPLHPDTEWFDFLELLAGQAALALENAGLYLELQEYATELEGRVAKRTAELQTANEQLQQAHDKVSQALDRERELNELKSRFLSMASHEFRTPLTTIFSSAELVEHYGERWTAEKRLSHMQRIKSTVERMSSLLEDVLLVSRADSGRLEFRPQQVDLFEFLGSVTEEYRQGMGTQHHIELNIHNLDKVRDQWVQADKRLLHIIFSNLISNGVKYSPPGSRVGLAVKRKGRRACIKITDQGIGIPEQDLPRLFEPFHRAANVGAIPGTGLGLNIVRHAVHLHGGTVNLQSVVGKGTTFQVELPLWPGQEV